MSVTTGRLDRWLAPKVSASRIADTAKEIAADPSAVTVRRTGRGTDLTLTVGIKRVGTRGSRPVRTTETAGVQTDVTILAMPGTDLRKGDRVRDAASNVYRIEFVMPGQEWRVEADAVVEE